MGMLHFLVLFLRLHNVGVHLVLRWSLCGSSWQFAEVRWTGGWCAPTTFHFKHNTEMEAPYALRSQKSDAVEEKTKESKEGQEECGICLEKPTLKGSLDCQHTFCFKCIHEWSKTKNTCPLCRTTFTTITKIDVTKCSMNLRVIGREYAKTGANRGSTASGKKTEEALLKPSFGPNNCCHVDKFE